MLEADVEHVRLAARGDVAGHLEGHRRLAGALGAADEQQLAGAQAGADRLVERREARAGPAGTRRACPVVTLSLRSTRTSSAERGRHAAVVGVEAPAASPLAHGVASGRSRWSRGRCPPRRHVRLAMRPQGSTRLVRDHPPAPRRFRTRTSARRGRPVARSARRRELVEGRGRWPGCRPRSWRGPSTRWARGRCSSGWAKPSSTTGSPRIDSKLGGDRDRAALADEHRGPAEHRLERPRRGLRRPGWSIGCQARPPAAEVARRVDGHARAARSASDEVAEPLEDVAPGPGRRRAGS